MFCISRIIGKLDEIIIMLKHVQRKEDHMGVAVDNLVVQAAKSVAVETAAADLLAKLYALVQAGPPPVSDDPAIQAAVDQLMASADNLAKVVADSTPVEQAPVEVPVQAPAPGAPAVAPANIQD